MKDSRVIDMGQPFEVMAPSPHPILDLILSNHPDALSWTEEQWERYFEDMRRLCSAELTS
jgi:hypothetical protein